MRKTTIATIAIAATAATVGTQVHADEVTPTTLPTTESTRTQTTAVTKEAVSAAQDVSKEADTAVKNQEAVVENQTAVVNAAKGAVAEAEAKVAESATATPEALRDAAATVEAAKAHVAEKEAASEPVKASLDTANANKAKHQALALDAAAESKAKADVARAAQDKVDTLEREVSPEAIKAAQADQSAAQADVNTASIVKANADKALTEAKAVDASREKAIKEAEGSLAVASSNQKAAQAEKASADQTLATATREKASAEKHLNDLKTSDTAKAIAEATSDVARASEDLDAKTADKAQAESALKAAQAADTKRASDLATAESDLTTAKVDRAQAQAAANEANQAVKAAEIALKDGFPAPTSLKLDVEWAAIVRRYLNGEISYRQWIEQGSAREEVAGDSIPRSFTNQPVDPSEPRYDITNLPTDLKLRLNQYFLKLVNDVRAQVGLAPQTMTEMSMKFADEIGKQITADKRMEFGHDVDGIATVAEKFGLYSGFKGTGGQPYESLAGLGYHVDFDTVARKFVTRKTFTEKELFVNAFQSLVGFLYEGTGNGHYGHAKHILSKDNMFVGIGFSKMADEAEHPIPQLSYIGVVSDPRDYVSDLSEDQKVIWSANPVAELQVKDKATLEAELNAAKTVAATATNKLTAANNKLAKAQKTVDNIKTQALQTPAAQATLSKANESFTKAQAEKARTDKWLADLTAIAADEARAISDATKVLETATANFNQAASVAKAKTEVLNNADQTLLAATNKLKALRAQGLQTPSALKAQVEAEKALDEAKARLLHATALLENLTATKAEKEALLVTARAELKAAQAESDKAKTESDKAANNLRVATAIAGQAAKRYESALHDIELAKSRLAKAEARLAELKGLEARKDGDVKALEAAKSALLDATAKLDQESSKLADLKAAAKEAYTHYLELYATYLAEHPEVVAPKEESPKVHVSKGRVVQDSSLYSAPVSARQMLPKTGEQDSKLIAMVGLTMATLLVGMAKKRKED